MKDVLYSLLSEANIDRFIFFFFFRISLVIVYFIHRGISFHSHSLPQQKTLWRNLLYAGNNKTNWQGNIWFATRGTRESARPLSCMPQGRTVLVYFLSFFLRSGKSTHSKDTFIMHRHFLYIVHCLMYVSLVGCTPFFKLLCLSSS
jgi:hypothetical protein